MSDLAFARERLKEMGDNELLRSHKKRNIRFDHTNERYLLEKDWKRWVTMNRFDLTKERFVAKIKKT